jgi:two-component system, LytTR family, sensor kinase
LKTFFNKYAFHLLYPVVYIGFLLQDKQWYSRNNDWLTYLPTFITHLALMFLLVYFNTLVLIPRLFLKGKVALYVVGTISIIALYTLLRSLYTQYSFYWLFELEQPEPIASFFWLSLVYGIWFTVISSMLYITQTWYEQKQQVKNIQINQLQTELKYLRAQMNPHFLFNGLNTVYGAIDKENTQAREILLQFSDLLRYSIYEAVTDFVQLVREVQHLENYVALQKVRSSVNLNTDLIIKIENRQVLIAPMLFLPLIENAFKFVSRDDNRNNFIRIVLRQNGNELYFECRNSVGNTTDKRTGGIGHINLKRRLELLYKDKYQFEIKQEENEYIVYSTITV